MRTYTNTLIFESVLDSLENPSPVLASVFNSIFKPTVKIVDEDCETNLGKVIPISGQIEGFIELDTNLPISKDRIVELITEGLTEVHTRSLSTCISEGGVCRKCLAASRPGGSAEPVGYFTQIIPEILIDSSRHSLATGQSQFTLKYSQEQFDKVYIYDNGVLVPDSSYSISGNILTLNSALPGAVNYLVQYAILSNADFYHKVSKSFGASLLGLLPLMNSLLPVPRKVLIENLPMTDVEDLISQLKASSAGGEDSVIYLDSVTDDLEKAILACMLSVIFLS